MHVLQTIASTLLLVTLIYREYIGIRLHLLVILHTMFIDFVSRQSFTQLGNCPTRDHNVLDNTPPPPVGCSDHMSVEFSPALVSKTPAYHASLTMPVRKIGFRRLAILLNLQ